MIGTYKYVEFEEVKELGLKIGSETHQRANVFLTNLAVRNSIYNRNTVYYTKQEMNYLLGGQGWRPMIEKMIDQGLILKHDLMNLNNHHQSLHVYDIISLTTLRNYVPVHYPRVRNSLNLFYDSRYNTFSETVRAAVLPNIRKTRIEVPSNVRIDPDVRSRIEVFNQTRGLDIYDYVKEDTFGHRVHTVVSNLPKELRPYINLSDEPLIELDLHQAQVMFLDRWLRLQDPENSFSQYYQETPDVYEALKEKMNLNTREEAKVLFCQTIFSRTHSRASRIFRESFPDASVYIDIKKAQSPLEGLKIPEYENHKNMAAALQREETKFMRRFWMALKRKRVPHLTIHDAVLVPASKVDQAQDILEMYLQESDFTKYHIHRHNLI